MQWQRVLHGFGAAIENTGRIHSAYEFSLKALPGRLICVRVVETPEGEYYGIPDHTIASDEYPEVHCVPPPPATTPEKALQEAVALLLEQFRGAGHGLRLVRLQNWPR